MHEFKPKNIESAKVVLHIVLHEGNSIGSSWGPLLHCVSQVCCLSVFGSSVPLVTSPV
jgi:hypothetical protein